jgi:hypothetical protein
MSEDETFRRLKRIPYLDMLDLFCEWVKTQPRFETYDDEDFFNRYGWTHKEFRNQLLKKSLEEK